MAAPILAAPTGVPRARAAGSALVAAHAATAVILLVAGIWEFVAGLSRTLVAPFGPAFLRLSEVAVAALGAAMVLVGLLALAAAVRLARGDVRGRRTGRMAAGLALLLALATFPSGILLALPAVAGLFLDSRADRA